MRALRKSTTTKCRKTRNNSRHFHIAMNRQEITLPQGTVGIHNRPTGYIFYPLGKPPHNKKLVIFN